jgi:hypothetical protein
MKRLLRKRSKIDLICNPADFKWSRAQQQEYITHNMADWARKDQDALLDAVDGAGTPGILGNARWRALEERARQARDYLPAPAKTDVLKRAAKQAKRGKAMWKDFDAVFEEVRDNLYQFYR